MIDLAELAKLVANVLGGVAILAVIISAAVAYLKQWGVRGKWLTGAGFAVGLVLALLIRYAMSPMHTFYDWVWAGVFGLMAGFLATGAYKVADGLAQKANPLSGFEEPSGPDDDDFIDEDDEPDFGEDIFLDDEGNEIADPVGPLTDNE